MTSAILKTLVALALAVCIAPSAVATPAAPKAAACALGAQVMAEQAKRGVDIFDEQQRYGPDYYQKATGREHWRLSEAHWRLLAKARPQSVFAACPNLMKQLPAGARMATPEDRIKVQQLGPHRLYVGTILTPLVAADGRSALVFEFTRCVGLCGGGSLYIYYRRGGAWIKGEPVFQIMS